MTAGYEEKKPLAAYKKLLRSSVPHAGAVSPGSSEVASSASRYWKDHLRDGAVLPYFSPFSINELNIFANVCGTNFVVYRQTGKRNQKDKTRPLQVVADTRLFSTADMNKCAHVVISNEGARKLSSAGLPRARIVQMLPNISDKNVKIYEKPSEILLNAYATCSDEMESATFMDLRSDVRLLDRFSIELGRPVRLLAVNCTSRFRKKEGRSPRVVRSNTVEQRTSVAGYEHDSEMLTLCLQAKTLPNGGVVVEAVENMSGEFCGPRQAGQLPIAPVVGKEMVKNAVAFSRAAAATAGAPTNQDRKLASQIRLDPCCRKEDESMCEACLQFDEEYAEGKRPEIGSSPFLYNPKKSAGSFLADAKSLGLCELFPSLEADVFKLNLLSSTSYDIETLSVPIAATGGTVGAQTSLVKPGEVKGGKSIIKRHVPFCIASTSFKLKGFDKYDVDGMVWRMQKETGVYREFRVKTTNGVPSQSDVAECVSEWLDYLEHRRKMLSRLKKAKLEPVARMLRDLEARSDEFLAKEEQARTKSKKDKTPSFRFSLFGNLLKKLETFTESINLISYNGSRVSIFFCTIHTHK